MTNDEILQERWQEVDELLSTFYTNNNKLNKAMYSRLQDIFNGINYKYEDLYKYATPNSISNFKNKVVDLKLKYELEGYTGYILDDLYNRKKLKNSDILMGLLTIAYYIQYQEQKKLEKQLFDEIVNNAYITGQQEFIDELNKRKYTLQKTPQTLTEDILEEPTYNGYVWNDYKEGNISYWTKHLFQVLAIRLQQGKNLDVYNELIMKELKKQERAYLGLKEEVKKIGYADKYYGAIDNQVCFITNKVILMGAEIQGCKRVKFVAVMDSKTTHMCRSLDEQVFKINGWNTFERYSASAGSVIKFRVKGLKVGVNLPPIQDHYHHCRSTIIPER